MKTKLYSIFLLIIIGFIKANACNLDVDSLFNANFSSIRSNLPDSSTCIHITHKDNLDFLYVVSILSGVSFITPESNSINLKTVLAIEEWYLNNAKFITYDIVIKAYTLLRPPLFKKFNELEKSSNELDELRIKGK